MDTDDKKLVKKFLPPIAHCKCFNATRIVHKGACLVCSVTVSAHTDAGSVLIYDGFNVTGELKARIEVLASTTFRWCLALPTDFDKGIYVTVDDEHTFVTVQWIPESMGEYV